MRSPMQTLTCRQGGRTMRIGLLQRRRGLHLHATICFNIIINMGTWLIAMAGTLICCCCSADEAYADQPRGVFGKAATDSGVDIQGTSCVFTM